MVNSLTPSSALTEELLEARVAEDPQSFHGRPQLEKIRDLLLLRREAVCRIEINDSQEVGSGCLIEGGLLLTNHHVLKDKDTARKSRAIFREVIAQNSLGKNTVEVSPYISLNPDRYFFTSPNKISEGNSTLADEEHLDFTLVALHPSPYLDAVQERAFPLFQTAEFREKDRICIMQYPHLVDPSLPVKGDLKWSIGQIHKIAESSLFSDVSTKEGSSGGAVLDLNGNLIALHYLGNVSGDFTYQRSFYTAGVLLSHIQKALSNEKEVIGAYRKEYLDGKQARETQSVSSQTSTQLLQESQTKAETSFFIREQQVETKQDRLREKQLEYTLSLLHEKRNQELEEEIRLLKKERDIERAQYLLQQEALKNASLEKKTASASLSSHLEELQRISQSKTFPEEETYIPVRATEDELSKVTCDLEEKVLSFMHCGKKTLLILGGLGAGKSTFSLYLEKALWKQWDPTHPIPILISLPRLKDPINSVVIEALKDKGFTSEQIEELRTQRRFLFILDAYDEINCQKNLYESNRLQDWQAQVIFTCRTQHFSGSQRSYWSFFTPYQGDRPQYDLFQELFIAPFEEAQVNSYLEKYVQVKSPLWKEWREYRKYIDLFPGLNQLIQTPFILSIVVKILPKLVEKYKGKEEKERLIRFDIYETFLHDRFDVEKVKLERTGSLPLRGEIKDAFLEISKDVALCMHQKKLVQISQDELCEIFSRKDKKRWKEKFGKKPLDLLTPVFRGLPLKKVAAEQYDFLHKSILEYFVSREVFEAVMAFSKKEDRPTVNTSLDPLYLRLLTEETAMIQFLVEKVEQDPSFKEGLFGIVETSKADPGVAIAAANAMTILSEARVPFSRMDLRGIRVPGADLSIAILDGTDLRESDLRGVKLFRAFLRNTRLENSQMQRVGLGGLPYLRFESPSPIAVSPKGQYIANLNCPTIELRTLPGGSIAKSISTEFPYFAGFAWFSCVAFSPDGDYLAAGNSVGIVHLWEISSENIVKLKKLFVSGLQEPIHNITFSPKGSYLAASGQEVFLYKIEPKKKIKEYTLLKNTGQLVKRLAFSSCENYLALGSNGGTITLWSVQCANGFEANCLASFSDHTDEIFSLSFSPYGLWLVSASKDRTVRVWDFSEKRNWPRISSTILLENYLVQCVAFSSEGKYLALGAQDTLQVWDFSKKEKINDLFGHAKNLIGLSFLSETGYIVSSSVDSTVRIWDLTQKATFEGGHTHGVISLAFSPDGRWLASGSGDRFVRVWDVEAGREREIFRGHTGTISQVSFCEKGDYLISAGMDDGVRLWDMSHKKEIKRILQNPVCGLAVSPDRKYFSVSSWVPQAQLHFWQVQNGGIVREEIWSPPKGKDKIGYGLAFSSNGRYLASGGEDGNVYLLRKEAEIKWIEEEHLVLLGQTSTIRSIIFSPIGGFLKGEYLVSANEGKGVYIWKVDPQSLQKKRKKYACFFPSEEMINITFSADGRYLASANKDNSIRLWKVNEDEVGNRIKNVSIQKLSTVSGHASWVMSVAFSPNGKYLATGSRDSSVRLWELSQQEEDPDLVLKWTTKSILICSGSKIKGADLEEDNKRLLLLEGATEDS